jgi:hypothetical protein
LGLKFKRKMWYCYKYIYILIVPGHGPGCDLLRPNMKKAQSIIVHKGSHQNISCWGHVKSTSLPWSTLTWRRRKETWRRRRSNRPIHPWCRSNRPWCSNGEVVEKVENMPSRCQQNSINWTCSKRKKGTIFFILSCLGQNFFDTFILVTT